MELNKGRIGMACSTHGEIKRLIQMFDWNEPE
jgi:hypothetical protein